jgi:hypothetical protein
LGTVRARQLVVDEGEKLRLSVRTILVTTRVAVRSQREAGNDGTASAAARRGLEMLGELTARLPDDAPPDVREQADAAREELTAMADDAPVTPSQR